MKQVGPYLLKINTFTGYWVRGDRRRLRGEDELKLGVDSGRRQNQRSKGVVHVDSEEKAEERVIDSGEDATDETKSIQASRSRNRLKEKTGEISDVARVANPESN
ncbi:hypothetical protein U1Q18_045806 [Sarracenia purpurea var. burkii]